MNDITQETTLNSESSLRSVILIQARYSSQRLPGKVLRPLCHTTLLGMLAENLSTLQIPLVVLTSDTESDKPVAEYCLRNQIDCYRGSLQNVAQRFADFLEQYPCDYFFRISGDSPLLDPLLLLEALEIAKAGSYDLITNVQKRSFPKGQSVELIRSSTFLRIQPDFDTDDQREHVTKIFYEKPHLFEIRNFESGEDYGHIQLSVDTSDDFDKISRMMQLNQCRRASWKKWTELEISLNHEA